MRAQFRRCRQIGVALVVAYMLVLQSFVGSFALASTPPLAGADAFGFPLCLSSTSTGDKAPGSDQNHHGLPACCSTACSMFSAFATEGRADHYPVRVFSLALDTLTMVVAEGLPVKLDHPPGNPRAPPATA